MTVMVAEVYDALRDVGVGEDKARRAAEAAADARSGLREEMVALRDEMRDRFADARVERQTMKGDVALLKWMFGALLAVNIAVLVRLLFM